MEKDRVEPVDTQQRQATLESAFHLVATEITKLRRTTDLGLENCPLGQSAEFPQRNADAPLAFTVAIPGGSIDVVQRTAERCQHRSDRLLLRHGVEKGVAHVAKGRAAHRDGRDFERRLAERATFQKLGTHQCALSPRS